MIPAEKVQTQLQQLLDTIDEVVIGKREVARLSIVALLAQGHVLLEDVPGVGKTMFVKALAKAINADFKRIQFTPDLLPSDVTGMSVYSPKDMEFHFKPGPILTNIVLADEINRSSPKTQAALLEAMAEQHVTIDGLTRELPSPFFVMATQNPIDFEGTYQLPEAQLDRFLFKLNMGYPTKQEELAILNGVEQKRTINDVQPVMNVEELRTMQQMVKDVYVDDVIKNYIVDLVTQTRTHESISLGVSPRGSVALMKAIQAYALLEGRDYCIPDDVQRLMKHAFAHRIMLQPETRYEGLTEGSVIESIIKRTPVPVKG
ncbi:MULTISPECIES: MoxR family ATPase [Bacillaceae]|uniref:AAA family ATPase n=1 Tax=Bacillaceae TaxID=186817 RepID=UPI00104C34A3|nr:MoxR family ATPase [Bacillus sp. CBEL-1]TDB55891.1 MoxR family ATPase [Bacillus sp. CBEL-1]